MFNFQCKHNSYSLLLDDLRWIVHDLSTLALCRDAIYDNCDVFSCVWYRCDATDFKMNRSQHSNTRAVQSLIQLVQTFADTKVVKSEVDKLSKIGIESYHDENDLDVLHHAIIANNIEAVTVLFFKGYFLPPHEYY